jgi:MIP family channel proteins
LSEERLYNLPQKLVAEFIGTFVVIFFSIGAICTDQYLRAASLTPIGTLGIALAYGLSYAIMVGAVSHISGGHLNPAVTAGYWVTRRLGTLQALFYWIAQLLGAIAATYVLVAMVPDAIWTSAGRGVTLLAPDFTRLHAMVLEGLMTFFLVFVVFATLVDARGAFNKMSSFAVGLAISVGVLFGGPFTGAAINPARAFAPALAARYWSNHGVYWVGSLLGGVIAAVIYDRLFLADQPPL